MRWLRVIIAVVAGVGLGSPAAVMADSVVHQFIETITFDSQLPAREKISFKLSGVVEPKIFAIPGEKPRLVVDFPQTLYKGDNVIPLYNSNLATRIRTGYHKDPIVKTRVVIDLVKSGGVRHRHDYLESEDILLVTLEQQAGEQLQENVAAAPAVDSKSVLAIPQAAQPDGKGEPSPPPSEESAGKQGVETGDNGLTAASPRLLDISFDDSSNRGEMVLFHLNDFYPPTVSAIEKENPRVLCDFMNMSLAEGVRRDITAGGRFVEHIRAEKHNNPGKVRIVLDLSPERDYDLQQVFFKNDNLFVLIVNELPEKKAVQ